MTIFSHKQQQITPRNTFVKLLCSAESVSADVHRFVAGHGLTVSQFGIFEALCHLGPLCQKNLAHKILNSLGNITIVIHNLEKRGLINRKRNESDKRYATISLTSFGRQLIEELFPIHVEHTLPIE